MYDFLSSVQSRQGVSSLSKASALNRGPNWWSISVTSLTSGPEFEGSYTVKRRKSFGRLAICCAEVAKLIPCKLRSLVYRSAVPNAVVTQSNYCISKGCFGSGKAPEVPKKGLRRLGCLPHAKIIASRALPMVMLTCRPVGPNADDRITEAPTIWDRTMSFKILSTVGKHS
jgi:hypothetical protein